MEVIKQMNGASNAFVILHGYGADNNDLFPLHSFLGNQFDYYFPNGPEKLPISPFQVGRAWFHIDLEGRVPGDPSISNYIYDYDMAIIKPRAEEIISYCEELKMKYNKIVIGGFSQGSMLALLCTLLRPDLFSFAALFSSHHFASDELRKLIKASNQKGIVFQSHAHDDMVLPYGGAEKLRNELQEQGILLEFNDFYGGHSISPQILEKLKVILSEKF